MLQQVIEQNLQHGVRWNIMYMNTCIGHMRFAPITKEHAIIIDISTKEASNEVSTPGDGLSGT